MALITELARKVMRADKKEVNMRKVIVYLFVLLLLVVPVLAQGAEWFPVSLKYDWNRKSLGGFCPYDSQCLVAINGSITYDNNITAYFKGNIPKCINDTQYILDYYWIAKILSLI